MGARPATISAIVTTRDRPQLLADALRSVAEQRLPPLEVRVADDGEEPALDALEAVRMLELTVIPVTARRAATARNLAARSARGEVLAFLDDDDRWLPDHLAGLAEAFADSAVGVAFRDCVVVRERLEARGARIEEARRIIAHPWDPALMRHDDYLPPSALAVRRRLFEHLGGFDESLRFSEDWDFLLRAAAETTPRRVPGATVEVRMRSSGNASADAGPERRECLDRLARRHGLPPLEIKTFWEVALAVEAAATGQ